MNVQLITAPQPTLKRRADVNGPDFYPTPRWATHALIDNEKFSGDIWECACGDGAMSEVLQETGSSVFSSDLYDRGFGDAETDFLEVQRTSDNIITNPPYNLAESFVKKGLECANQKVALLLRLAFLEGARRQNTIFKDHRPSKVWVFSERITFYPKGVTVKGSGTTAYAWFVWDKDAPNKTEFDWLPLGYKAKFS